MSILISGMADNGLTDERRDYDERLLVEDVFGDEITVAEGESTVEAVCRTSFDQEFIASKSVESEKVPRRRQIDPTTCERDYTDAEIEFMNALDQYKRSSGRMFPTCSEILEVLLSLGYRKQESPQVAVIEPEEVIKTPPSGTPTFAPEGEHESQYVFSPADDYREPLMIF